MTIGELRATAQDIIGPHNGMRPLSASILDEYLYKACTSVFKAIRNWRTRGEANINIVANTASYDLPANVYFVESVVLVNAEGCAERISPIRIDEDKHQEYSSLAPGYYVGEGSTTALQAVYLLPTPLASVTAGLKVRYRKRPTRLSTYSAVSDEFVDVDPDLHLPICHEAAYLYLQRQGSKAAKDFTGLRVYFQNEVASARERHEETHAADFIPTINVRFGGLE